MADSSPATVTVTLRPTVSVQTLKDAAKNMDSARRNTLRIKLEELAKQLSNSGNL